MSSRAPHPSFLQRQLGAYRPVVEPAARPPKRPRDLYHGPHGSRAASPPVGQPSARRRKYEHSHPAPAATVYVDYRGRPNPYSGRYISYSPALLQTVLEHGYTKQIRGQRIVSASAAECEKYLQIIKSWTGGGHQKQRFGFVHMEVAYVCTHRANLPREVMIKIWDEILYCSPVQARRSLSGKTSFKGIHSMLTVEAVIVGLKLIQTELKDELNIFAKRMSYERPEQAIPTNIDPNFKFTFNINEARVVMRSQLHLPKDVRAPVDKTTLNLNLHIACKDGNVDLIRQLIADGAKVAHREDGTNMTAIHKAVLSGSKEAVDLCLEGGGSFTWNVRDKDGYEMSALIHAILVSANHETFDYGIIDMMVASGINLDEPFDSFGTALHVCASFGNIGAARSLLAGGANCRIQVGGDLTYSPIQLAAAYNLKALVALMEEMQPIPLIDVVEVDRYQGFRDLSAAEAKLPDLGSLKISTEENTPPKVVEIPVPTVSEVPVPKVVDIVLPPVDENVSLIQFDSDELDMVDEPADNTNTSVQTLVQNDTTQVKPVPINLMD
ncbi:hypothetical protein ABW19_dt0202152 [Dactylella cylindrospora]|nr:hypothetical protein ABW19_dt0202152 [Dactylella cylindrospora]